MSIDEATLNLIKSAGSLEQEGRYNEARGIYQEILAANPDFRAAKLGIGVNMLKSEETRHAGASTLVELLGEDPTNTAALRNLAIYYYEENRFQDCENSCQRQVIIEPDNPDGLMQLAHISATMGKHDQAIECCKKVITVNPSIEGAYGLLLFSLLNRRRLIEVLIWAKRWEKTPHANHNLILAFRRSALSVLSLFDEAQKLFNTDNESEYLNQFHLGHFYQSLGNIDAAKKCYESALKYEPENFNCKINLGILLLGKGDFRRGWNLYDSRFIKGAFIGPHGHPEPEWGGQELKGEGILIHSEQGLGDIIQFMRFFPMIKSLGGRIIFSSSTDILALMKSDTNAKVVQDYSTIDLSYSWQIPLLNLGKLFVGSIEDIPASTPYLSAPPKKISDWNKRFSHDPSFKVGLVWAGNPVHANDHNRSMSLEDFAPLAEVAGLLFIALQKGATADQVLSPPNNMHIISVSDEIADFSDTAAIIENLDLVICVDTSIAHLAGALNKPTWLLLPEPGDWRWLTHREDSPWYPSLRIFRRNQKETWVSLVKKIKNQLIAWRDSQKNIPPAVLHEIAAVKSMHALDWKATENHFSAALKTGAPADRIVRHLCRHYKSEDTDWIKSIPSADNPYYLDSLTIPTENIKESEVTFWLNRDPHHENSLISEKLSKKLRSTGRHLQAIGILKIALEKNLKNWKLHYELAENFRAANDYTNAETEYKAALETCPRSPEAGINHAITLSKLDKLDEAITQFTQTYLYNQNNSEIKIHLTNFLQEIREYELALAIIKERQKTTPDDEGYCWQAYTLRQLGRFAEALSLLNKLPHNSALSYWMEFEKASCRIGINPELAEENYKTLINIAPPNELSNIEFGLGTALLSKGKYFEGWRLFEARLQAKGDIFTQFALTLEDHEFSKIPEWQGENLDKKTLLIFCEQGFGDTIQFIRFLNLITGKCILIFQDGLEALLKNWFARPDTTIISRSEYKSQPLFANYHINLMSIPCALNLGNNLLGGTVPYFKNITGENKLTEFLDDSPNLRIGLIWSGNPKHGNDHFRSIPLLELLPFWSVEKTTWYSLQKGAPSTEGTLLPQNIEFINAASLSNDFHDTALIIEKMDLIISVDTAVAHLAGAMGKHVWIMIPRLPDWRWGISGQETNWYPKTRIFRQSELGNWKPVIAEICEALNKKLSHHD